MADELKQSQLARIVVPAITDVKYAEGMADAFDKINDNFKKIASLPFLQGVQGDSYQLEEYLIWEKDTTENWILTEDGKALLNSIFGKDVTTDGNSFNNIRDYIGEELDDVSPLDFFKNGNDIVNNSLYFYVIKDDTGNVIEKQIGQFYYFIDGRIKNIGTVYGDKTSSELLSTFNDYTGFYQYNVENNSYTRLEILPSIYYDQNKNDICWKFNGNKTGISAIGVEGRPGKDATLSIVKVTVNSTDVSGVVEAEFKYDETNKFGVWDTNNIEEIKDGKAIICCYYPIYYKIGNNNITIKGNKQTTKDLPSTGNKTGDGWFVQGILFGWDGSNWLMVQQGLNFAYGELIRSNDGTLCAYWNQGSMMSHVINNLKINSYFYDMGESQNASAPHYLAIPSDSNRITGTNKSSAHVIRNSRGDLEFLNSTDVFVSPEEQNKSPKGATGTPKTVKLTNYNFKVGKIDNKSVRISSDTVKIGATTYIGTTGAVIDGGLSVKKLTVGSTGAPGKTDIFGETNIYKGYLYIGDRGATGSNGITIQKGDIKLHNGNIGVTGAINASENIVANKNLEATTGNLTVGNNGYIKGQTLTLGVTGSTSGPLIGRSTTVITNTGEQGVTGVIKSKFSLNVNGLETNHQRYFTINSSSPIGATGASNCNIARISLGSTASNIKENYIQICAGEDVVYGNNGARAGIQIHSNPDGKNGDVKIKPNLTVDGPGTINGKTTIKNGNIEITTSGNQIILPTKGVSWKDTNNLDNSSIYIKGPNSTSTSFHSLIGTNTKSNNIVNIGVVNDNFGFYGIKDGSDPTNGPDWRFDIDTNTGNVNLSGDLEAHNINANDISVNNISANDISVNNISANDISVNNISANDISVNNISANDIDCSKITCTGNIDLKNIFIDDTIYTAKNVINKYWPSNSGTNNDKTGKCYSKTSTSGISFVGLAGRFTSKNTTASISYPETTIKISNKVQCKGTNGLASQLYWYKIYGVKVELYLKSGNKTINLTSTNSTDLNFDEGCYATASQTKNRTQTLSVKLPAITNKSITLDKNTTYSIYIKLTYTETNYKYRNYIDGITITNSYIVENDKNWTVTQKLSEQNDISTIVFRNGVVSGYNRGSVTGFYTADSSAGADTYLFATYIDTGTQTIKYKTKKIIDLIGGNGQSL